MPVIEKTALVEYPQSQMFELVEQVEHYPEFMPWCGGTEVHRRTDDKIVATIHINYHGIKAHFSTENDKEPPDCMTINLRHGPFQRLEGVWRFIPLGDTACKIDFRLDYEFSSRLLEKALGPVFHKVASSFIDAFIRRAAQIHGPR